MPGVVLVDVEVPSTRQACVGRRWEEQNGEEGKRDVKEGEEALQTSIKQSELYHLPSGAAGSGHAPSAISSAQEHTVDHYVFASTLLLQAHEPPNGETHVLPCLQPTPQTIYGPAGRMS